jgi:prepilin-type N-terminal cleavage/methylation domain-containing protein
MRKAFTLIELVVALGVLAIVLSFAGVIFRVSIDSQRLAMANAEIMQKFRVITQQLDADFRGRIAEYGGALRTNDTTVGPNEVTVRSDSIAFFACGDFQSTNQYNGRTVVGNVAAIFYGQPDPNSYPVYPLPRQRLLLRRQTILAPEPPGGAAASEVTPVAEWGGEYYSDSLSQWRTEGFVDANDLADRPSIDPTDVQSYQFMYLAEGVGDFAAHYLPLDADADDLPGSWTRYVGDSDGQTEQMEQPRALKFTFTLYDSRGIIEDGRTFTHIVPWSE